MRVFNIDSPVKDQQFRGGAPGLKERELPTSRKREASRPGRTTRNGVPRAVRAGKARAQKPTLPDTHDGTVAVRLPIY
jgi:hypothetical protein